MSIPAMDMSSYETDKVDRPASLYDEEVLCAGWIPDLALQQSQGMEQPVALPESLATVSADIFLEKIYSFQR